MVLICITLDTLVKTEHCLRMQLASDSFISDTAMEATLQGRADYASILADLGFLPRTYVDTCSSSYRDGNGDSHAGLDEYSANARVIKAAICAGVRLRSY